MKNLNVLDVLLNEEDRDPMELIDGEGKKWTFKQIAVIPRGDKIYAILKPIGKVIGIADDEAIVFYVNEDEEEPVLMIEPDEMVAKSIFEEYYDLLEESFRDNK